MDSGKMKIKCKELTIFILYLSLIILAEVVTSIINPNYGLIIHSILLLTMIALSAFWQKTNHSSNLFLCLSIAPLIEYSASHYR